MLAKATITVIFSTFLIVGLVFAQQKQETANADMLSAADRNFMTSTAEANLGEIETAKMVEQKTTDPAVKDFANRMIDDHTHANQSLATLATMTKVTLPTQSNAAERNQMSELQNLSGSKLDQAYLRAELQGHKQVISKFNNEIEHGQDSDVKKYAEQTLPTLEDHIRIAENIAGKLDMPGKAGLNQENKAIAVK